MRNKSIYVLGINEALCASAAILKDGKIIAAVQEERFTRIKNVWGFPTNAVKFCCDFAKIKTSDLDLVVLSYNDPYTHFTFGQQARERPGIAPLYLKFLGKLAPKIEYKIPFAQKISDLGRYFYYTFYEPGNKKKQEKEIAAALNISTNKIIRMDHHLTHAYTTYYSNPDNQKNENLVFTCDGAGDQKCAAIYIVKNGKWKLLSSTPHLHSLGLFYSSITHYLGMRPHEDEYKVMGLAPYSNKMSADYAYSVLKELIWVDGLTLQSKIRSRHFDFYLKEKLAFIRFDHIAWAAQKLTEKLLAQWITNAVTQTGIRNICVGGGTFLNVKANKKISELKKISKAFFMPSSSDDSNALGACYYGYQFLCRKNEINFTYKPLNNLYLGPHYGNEDILKACTKNKNIKIKKYDDITPVIAKLLSNGEIVARFSGRMEFGARALGNRSILTRPDNPAAVSTINQMIKMRDFWMPFAATILVEFQNEYIKNPKKIASPYMAIAFDTTPAGQDKLKAAIHPADHTTRAQILKKTDNPRYYEIIEAFRKFTGIGALLNTSFNIHGEPIVCTPDDALSTLSRSGLKYLAMENFLISKI